AKKPNTDNVRNLKRALGRKLKQNFAPKKLNGSELTCVTKPNSRVPALNGFVAVNPQNFNRSAFLRPKKQWLRRRLSFFSTAVITKIEPPPSASLPVTAAK